MTQPPPIRRRRRPGAAAGAVLAAPAARLRETCGMEAVIGSIATPEGPRRICAPVVAGTAPG